MTKPRTPKIWTPTAGNIGLLVLVVYSGFIFIESWRIHSSGTIARGIIFVGALVALFAFDFLFTKKK